MVKASQDSEATTVFAGFLPGCDHTPYRGEIYAIWVALSCFVRPCICIDCSAAKMRLDELILCHVAKVNPPRCDHWDIWGRIWSILISRPVNSVSTRKVKAHADWKSITDPNMRRDAWFNDLADKAAKNVLLNFSVPISERSHVISRNTNRILLHFVISTHTGVKLTLR